MSEKLFDEFRCLSYAFVTDSCVKLKLEYKSWPIVNLNVTASVNVHDSQADVMHVCVHLYCLYLIK
ncbi:unnamed protein product, partial [Nesidiocoris tenuis]